MTDSRYQRGPGQTVYPQGNGQSQVPEPDAPDFMQLAASQVRRVIEGIEARTRELARTPGSSPQAAEWDPQVRQARLDVADRLIALAEIQYAIPEDPGGDEGGEDEDGYSRR